MPKHGKRFLPFVATDDRTANDILKQQMKERGEKPLTLSDIDRRLANPKNKYGNADYEHFPELEGVQLGFPLRLPKRFSPALWDALERFVQLTDSGLEDFKGRYPSFFPEWFYNIPVGNNAESKRKGLFAWQAWCRLLRQAWQANLHPEYVAHLLNIPTVPPGNTRFEIAPVCDAQRAVLAIMLEPWRARFCPRCGLRFVARNPADKYRPTKCFEEQRREAQQAATKRYRRRKRAKSSRRSRR